MPVKSPASSGPARAVAFVRDPACERGDARVQLSPAARAAGHAALRVVGRDADGHSVARDDLDAESPHAATQLREDFMAGIHLHTVQATAVHRHDGPLHINQIVFAQSANPFIQSSNDCATSRLAAQPSEVLLFTRITATA